MKAFKVKVDAFPLVTAFYAAETAGKARYRVWSNLHELGWTVGFNEIHVTRASEFDEIASSTTLKFRYLGSIEVDGRWTGAIHSWRSEDEGVNQGMVL